MLRNRTKPLLFAHRGASVQAPENTLEAFELAARTGADVLELDVHLSADGAVVVHHDETLERTTDGTGALAHKSLADLRRLDAGYHFKPHHGFPFRDKGVQIPVLSEVLGAFPRVAFNIELKGGGVDLVRPVLEVLEQVGVEHVILTAGNDEIMRAVEATSPGVPLGMSRAQVKEVVKASWFGTIPERYAGRALQIPAWAGPIPVATSRVLRRATAAGLFIDIWTINRATETRDWLRRGVHGVMTDDPSTMATVFADFAEESAAKR